MTYDTSAIAFEESEKHRQGWYLRPRAPDDDHLSECSGLVDRASQDGDDESFSLTEPGKSPTLDQGGHTTLARVRNKVIMQEEG